MKIIQRYARFYAANSIGAGVYAGGVTLTLTMGPFAIVINRFQATVRAYDNVTSQQQKVNASMTVPISAQRDNPGITSPGLDLRFLFGDSGFFDFNLYHTMVPSEVVAISYNFYLATVTANIINAQTTLIVGYLCPEDFLSIDLQAG